MDSRDVIGDYSSPSHSSFGDMPEDFADISTNFSAADLDKNTTNAVALALTGKNRVGPRTYDLEFPMRGQNHDEFSILVIGCTGDNSNGQKAVGAMMAKHQDAAFILHLGDAFYTKGLQHVADTKMVGQRLTGPYDGIKFNGKKPVMLCTAGNHDGNWRNVYAKLLDKITRSADNPLDNFNALTFFDKDPKVVEEKIKYFSQRRISLSDKNVGFIFFPHPFYSVVIGKVHQKIILNTCTIVVDYIRFTELMKTLVELRKKIQPAYEEENDILSFSGFHKFIHGMTTIMDQYIETCDANENHLSALDKAAFESNVDLYNKTLSELEINQIGWLLSDPLAEAFQFDRQLTLVSHHSRAPSTNRATYNDDKLEYFSPDQYAEIVALLGLDPKRSHNMYKILDAMYQNIGLLPFQELAAHEHCTSVTNSLASNPNDDYPLRLYTIGSGGDKAHCQYRGTHARFPDCTYFRTNESGFAKITYSGSKPFSYILQTFSLDGLEHRFSEASVVPFAKQVLNQKLKSLRDCVFNAYKTYCQQLKNEDLRRAEARALAKAQRDQATQAATKQETAPAAPVRKASSIYSWSGLKSAFYSGAKAGKDLITYAASSANRFINKQNTDHTFDKQLAIVQHIFAYFSQFQLSDLKFEICLNKLIDLVIELTKTTEEPAHKIEFINILQAEVQKTFKDINIFDFLPKQNKKTY